MKVLENKAIGYLILAITFVAGAIVIVTTFNSFGGADNYSHYQLAYWGWKYPELLFDHWGKPVYTILSSSFAQFGINGSRFFNLIAGIATAFLIWKTAIKLKIKNHVLALILVIFTPIYFSLMFTSLTEVLFSLFLTLAIYLFFNDKFIWSAIVISFIPLVRTEGIVLIPLFWTAYICKRKYVAIFFTIAGFLIVSTAGYFFFDDYWWLITKMPYKGDAENIYGSGSLLHFVNDTRGIMGYPIAYLFIIGIGISIHNWAIKDKFRLNTSFYILFLVAGSFIIFFSAHSYVWWKGIGNSLGLIRVIGSVTPLIALIALPALNLVISLIGKINKHASLIFLSALIIWIIILGFSTHRGGFKPGKEQIEILRAAEYLKENNINQHKIHYFNPLLITELDIDPYDSLVSAYGITNRGNPSQSITDSSIIVWDAHFGPNEGALPLKNLLDDQDLVLLKFIFPEEPFKTLGKYQYGIYIFQKTVNQDLLKMKTSNDFVDLNLRIPACQDSSLYGETAEKYYKINSNKEYMPLFEANCSDLESDKNILMLIEGKIFSSDIDEIDPAIVISISDNNKNYFYNTFHPTKNNFVSTENDSVSWGLFSHFVQIQSGEYNNSKLKIYFWNFNKNSFYFKDINIKLKYTN